MMIPGKPERWGAGDLVLKALLAAILCVLVVLLFVVLLGRREDTRGTTPVTGPQPGPVVQPGETVQRPPTGPQPGPVVQPGETVQRPPTAPPPPPMVGKPDRIRDVLQEGKTYEVITTADLTGPVRDKEWGFETTVNLAYRAELRMWRTIEKNDGHQIVERREIKECRMVKGTSTAEVKFIYTEPGVLLFGGIDYLLTGGQATAVAVSVIEPVCAVAGATMQGYLNDNNTKIAAKLDSLSGKTVRITFEDGRGVTTLEPAGCSLTEEERDFLFGSAVLTDAFILPDESSHPGQVWQVDGSAFVDFLPPSWRGVPEGAISIRRERDFEERGNKYALLKCYAGTIQINATDNSRARLATLTPRGELKYNITDGHIESGELNAEGTMEEASRDHLLFETRFETNPTVRLTYSCAIIEPR